MRTLILSDIHGNLAALEAVATDPHDDVICLGDVVGYGPEPGACVAWVREHAAVAVQGNHDRSAFDGSQPQCRRSFTELAEAVRDATRSQMGATEREYLGSLPPWRLFSCDRVRYLLVHATPRNPLYRYLPSDAAAWRQELAGVEADIVLVGHTHLPRVLEVDQWRLINPGSVGLPKDGDARASYAILEHGEITLKRVGYSIERTLDRLRRLSMPAATFADLSALLRTGRPDALRGRDAALMARDTDPSVAGSAMRPSDRINPQ
jgi:predicted phosphodiesterase